MFKSLMHLQAHTCSNADQPLAAPAGARFRLLLLALRHCKQCQADATQRGVACPFATTMLLEKVLAMALQYFQAPPAWYGRWTKSEARSVKQDGSAVQNTAAPKADPLAALGGVAGWAAPTAACWCPKELRCSPLAQHRWPTWAACRAAASWLYMALNSLPELQVPELCPSCRQQPSALAIRETGTALVHVTWLLRPQSLASDMAVLTAGREEAEAVTQFAEEVALDSPWPQQPRQSSQQGLAVPSAALAHPVWGRSHQRNQQRVELLHLLLHSEAERLAIWATPRASKLRSRVSAFASGSGPSYLEKARGPGL